MEIAIIWAAVGFVSAIICNVLENILHGERFDRYNLEMIVTLFPAMAMGPLVTVAALCVAAQLFEKNVTDRNTDFYLFGNPPKKDTEDKDPG